MRTFLVSMHNIIALYAQYILHSIHVRGGLLAPEGGPCLGILIKKLDNDTLQGEEEKLSNGRSQGGRGLGRCIFVPLDLYKPYLYSKL